MCIKNSKEISSQKTVVATSNSFLSAKMLFFMYYDLLEPQMYK